VKERGGGERTDRKVEYRRVQAAPKEAARKT